MTTTTATLWISETPVSIAVEFWKIFGLLVNNKSINYSFFGFFDMSLL